WFDSFGARSSWSILRRSVSTNVFLFSFRNSPVSTILEARELGDTTVEPPRRRESIAYSARFHPTNRYRWPARLSKARRIGTMAMFCDLDFPESGMGADTHRTSSANLDLFR